MMPRPLQSRYLGTSYSSPNRHQLPHHIFLNLIDGMKSLPFQRWFLVWGKARSCRVPNLGCSGAESSGWFYVLPKNSAQDVMHEWTLCHDEAANHQLPIAVAVWIIQKVSTEEYSNLTQNWMRFHWSTHSVILNVTATQYTCSLRGFYRPHWLVQWSRHCSHMRISVHSPWLPGYINAAQTILFISTMAGLFPDRPDNPSQKLAKGLE